jgi:hypothetical protein
MFNFVTGQVESLQALERFQSFNLGNAIEREVEVFEEREMCKFLNLLYRIVAQTQSGEFLQLF